MQPGCNDLFINLGLFANLILNKHSLIVSVLTSRIAAHDYLLVLQIEVFGDVHALQPADIATAVSCLGKSLFQGLGLLQGHDMQGVPSPPCQDVGNCC